MMSASSSSSPPPYASSTRCRDKQVTNSNVHLPDHESGMTDFSSSPFQEDHDHAAVEEVDKVNKPHESSARTCRILSWLLGMATLAGAVVGLVYFVNHKGYGLGHANARHSNYQGMVSVSQLQAHNDPDTDCWMELHGLVYDLTDYAPRHPGGAEYVTDYCGTNATKFYDLEHPTRYLATIKQYNLGAAVTDQEYAAAATTTTQGDATAVGVGDGSSSSGGQGSSSSTSSSSSSNNEDSEDESEDERNDEEGDESTYTGGRTPQPPTTQGTAGTSAATTTAAAATQPTEPQGCPVQYYSTETVQQHNTRFDCWYILYDRIYDFTSYVDRHPGGARRVFEHCGTDATAAYVSERKHDLQMLNKETPNLWIGMWGEATEVRYQPC